jgi:hypothetical protein
MLRRSEFIQHVGMTITSERVYFTVLDAAGNAMPAVEYWAAVMEEDAPVYEVLPLRRFVKVLGSSEPLKQTGQGTFEGAYSGQMYTALTVP